MFEPLMPGQPAIFRAMPVFAMAMAALAWTGCAGSVGTTARSMLSHIRENPDPNTRFEAYTKLGRKKTYDNDSQILESVAELSQRLVDGKEPAISRAVICRSLGTLQRPEAREALIKALEDEDDEVRSEAARALGKVGTQEDAVLLARMMAIDTTHNGRVAAAEGLTSLKPQDPRILIALTENLNNDDPAIRLAAYRALKGITKADPGTDTDTWQEYLVKTVPGFGSEPSVVEPRPQIARRPSPAPSPSDVAVRPVGLSPGEIHSALPPQIVAPPNGSGPPPP